MRLSSLVVAVLLLFSPFLFAQHSSGGGSSSGGSSGHSGGSPGGSSHSSSGASASHGSSGSGGYSPSSHASAGGGSAHSHNPISSSHNSTAGTAEARASTSPLRFGTEPSRSDAARTIRAPVAKGEHGEEKELSAAKTTQPEKRGFFSFLRHPFRKPEPKPKPKPKPEPHPEPRPAEPDLRVICKREPCVVCPPGRSAGRNGGCPTSTVQPYIASTQCPPNEFWNGGACAARPHCQPGEFWDGASCVNTAQCATFSSRADLLTAEARGINADVQAACSKDPSGQECARFTQNHDGAVQRYRMLLNEAPVRCRTLLPDPLSL
jgi:hypothetical protein